MMLFNGPPLTGWQRRWQRWWLYYLVWRKWLAARTICRAFGHQLVGTADWRELERAERNPSVVVHWSKAFVCARCWTIDVKRFAEVMRDRGRLVG